MIPKRKDSYGRVITKIRSNDILSFCLNFNLKISIGITGIFSICSEVYSYSNFTHLKIIWISGKSFFNEAYLTKQITWKEKCWRHNAERYNSKTGNNCGQELDSTTKPDRLGFARRSLSRDWI